MHRTSCGPAKSGTGLTLHCSLALVHNNIFPGICIRILTYILGKYRIRRIFSVHYRRLGRVCVTPL